MSRLSKASKSIAAIAGIATLSVFAINAASAAVPATTHSATRAAVAGQGRLGAARAQLKTGKVKVGNANSNSFDVVNNTPYVMTLTADSYNNHDWPSTRESPAATLQPGQRSDPISVDAGLDGFRLDSDVARVEYQFTDVHGVQHKWTFQTSDAYYTNDWNNGLIVGTYDLVGGGWVPTTEFNWSSDGSSPLNVRAQLKHPDELTIDAAKEPARAAAIMKQFVAGTHRKYTATSGITFTHSPATAVTGQFINSTSQPAQILLTHSIENSQTTSLGAEAGLSTTLSLLGLANTTVSATIDTTHTWGVASTTADSASLNLAPGQVGWITRATLDGTVTGNFDFTNSFGIIFHVENVTVTAQSVTDPNEPMIPNYTYGQGYKSTR